MTESITPVDSSLFREREFKVRTNLFGLKGKFRIGTRRQGIWATELVEEGVPEEQAVKRVEEAMNFLDQVL